MKNIICFVSSMDAGGAETFLMKIYRTIDKDNYRFDFIVNSKHRGFYDNEIEKLGGHIFYSPPKSKHPFLNLICSYKIIKCGNYDAAMRMTSHSLGTIDLLVAKIAGVKKLILRSTNAGNTGHQFSHFLHHIFFFLPQWIPSVKIAPSKLAAEYLFGTGCIENGDVKILPNGIPVEKFLFSDVTRTLKRKELGLDDNFIVGHIGRFSEQKNHKFLIQIFNEIHCRNTNARLVLIGAGELENDIKKQVDILKLSDSVLFLGVRKDVSKLLMAIDVFIFPSLFEGMPNVLIEAQASGLPCIISDRITPEVQIIKYLRRLSLKEDASFWANQIDYSLNYSRKEVGVAVLQAGYDVEQTILQFETYFAE